jgi:hypothetical protein
MNHAGITSGCATCHGGTYADVKTKPLTGHIPTAQPCELCHTSLTSFASWRMDHTGITNGCVSCHGGQFTGVRAKPRDHPRTSDLCEDCHTTRTFSKLLRVSPQHPIVTPGSCATCHNNVRAPGKPPKHLLTTLSCDACHRSTTWVPANFTHPGVVAGNCASCHTGATAKGIPAGHFVTTRSCDTCHRVTGWTPALPYRHLAPSYRQHQPGVACQACHKGNTEVATWTAPAFKPDCAGCHAAQFRPDKHRKSELPPVSFTVVELKDCAGTCHAAPSGRPSTKPLRISPHHATDGAF